MKNQFLGLALLCILITPILCNTTTKEEARKPVDTVDVVTGVVFPQSADRQFPIGKPIDVVVGFVNNGKFPLNVTSVGASLMYPYDWRVHIQNFTRLLVNDVVQPGEQASYYYIFYPDPMLEPREFGLTGRIFFSTLGGGANFTSVFYNSTIALTEVSDSFDAETIFSYVLIVGVAGLAGLFVFGVLFPGSKKGGKRAPKVETGTQDANLDEWLPANTTKSPKGRNSPTQSKKKN